MITKIKYNSTGEPILESQKESTLSCQSARSALGARAPPNYGFSPVNK